MRYLVVRTLDHLVLVELASTLEAEGVAAWEGDGLLVVVVVRFETDATLKDLIHIIIFCNLIIIEFIEVAQL